MAVTGFFNITSAEPGGAGEQDAETNSTVGTVTVLLAVTPRNFGLVLITVNRICSRPQHPDCFRIPSSPLFCGYRRLFLQS